MGLSAGAICAMDDDEFHEWSKRYEENRLKTAALEQKWTVIHEAVHPCFEKSSGIKVIVEKQGSGAIRSRVESVEFKETTE